VEQLEAHEDPQRSGQGSEAITVAAGRVQAERDERGQGGELHRDEGEPAGLTGGMVKKKNRATTPSEAMAGPVYSRLNTGRSMTQRSALTAALLVSLVRSRIQPSMP
jgi:hypothetical protein